METSHIFVGFGKLDAWAEAVDPDRPVLAMPLVQSGPEHGGLRVDELLVVCQQVSREGTVLYCRLRAASLTRCFGEPFDADWQDREAAWKSLWEAVEAYLKGRSFVLRRATVAWPRGYVFLEATGGSSIRFDREAKRYRLCLPAAGGQPTPGPSSGAAPQRKEPGGG